MLANINSKLTTLFAALLMCCIFSGCASKPGIQSNIALTSDNAQAITDDAINLVNAILGTIEFPERLFQDNRNDPFLKKLGLNQKPKRFETVNLVSNEAYLISSKENGLESSWKVDNMDLTAKLVFKSGTYSLTSKQLMNIETQDDKQYQLFIMRPMTYKTDREFEKPDKGAFVIIANNSNMYVVIENGEIDIRLEEKETIKI